MTFSLWFCDLSFDDFLMRYDALSDTMKRFYTVLTYQSSKWPQKKGHSATAGGGVMNEAMRSTGAQEKMSELLGNLEELQKATEVVRCTALEICEWLRIGTDAIGKEPPLQEPQPSLITQRTRVLAELRQHLYETHSYLMQIMSAVREI